MENKNLENTVKKMAIVLEKLAKKVDELDKRVQKLELKSLAKEGQQTLPQTQQQATYAQPQNTGSSFGTGFLSSLLGSFAGMSLFSLLFNRDVSAEDVAKEAGISEDELAQIEERLDSIDEKLAEIEENLDDTGIDNADFTEPDTFGYEDIDADIGFDDFDTDIV